MMKLKSVLGIALATAIITAAIPSFSQSASEDRVSFFCKAMFDNAAGEQIPATVAWVPQRNQNVPIIYWKSDYFEAAGWDGQKRCGEVTPKFQTFLDNNRLNYLTHGKVGPYPVICAVGTQNGETCNADNQLFQLKQEADGDNALQSLMDILERKGGDAPPLYESSGAQIYVPMNEFLLNAPAVED